MKVKDYYYDDDLEFFATALPLFSENSIQWMLSNESSQTRAAAMRRELAFRKNLEPSNIGDNNEVQF